MEKIVIMVLITLTMGQAKEDLDIMKEMMVEMNERLSLAEEKLAKTEDELAATKDELAITKAKTVELERDAVFMKEMMAEMNYCLAKTEDELAISKADNAMTKAKTDELEREVTISRAPPYIHSCGSHYDYLSGDSGTIPYTSLLYSSSNTEGGGLDISLHCASWRLIHCVLGY